MSDKTLSLQIVLELLGAGKAAEAQAAFDKLKTSSADLSKEMGVINVTADDMEKALAKTADATHDAGHAAHEAEIPHRQLHESIHLLAKGYPELGELARSALHPVVLASFGIAEAFHIWNERMKTAQELLGAFELPDFTAHAGGVSAAVEAFDKLKIAVRDTNTEFNSGAAAFERQKTAIQEQLGFMKQLIAAQKEKAIADLDLERSSGKITPGMYDAKRSIIEQGYNAETVRKENEARIAEVNAKWDEAQTLAQESAAAKAKAAKIHPELNDEGFEEQINKAKSGAEAAKAQAEEDRKRAKLARDQQATTGVDTVTPEGLKRAFDYSTTFGATTDPEEAAKGAEAAAKNAEETQAGLEVLAKKLEKQREERDKLNAEAAAKAAEAEKKQLELKGEDDPNKVGSAAWKNAASTAVLRSQEDTAAETRAAKDIENFGKDVAEFKQYATATDPAGIAKAREALKDMQAMFKDVLVAVNQLAADHQDVKPLRQQVDRLQWQMQHLGLSAGT